MKIQALPAVESSIMVVADDPESRRQLREALQRAGYIVVAVGDGPAVAQVVRGLDFDAIVVQGGVEVERRVAAAVGNKPLVPIAAAMEAERVPRLVGRALAAAAAA